MTSFSVRFGNRSDATAGLLIAGFVLFLLVFGARFHTIEIPDSAENDGYVVQADEIRAGNVPRDPYHPLLYQILSAGVGALLNDSFAGARVVSSLMAGIFLLMTYLVGRAYFGAGVALFSVVALALNYNVITTGMDATTDMCFSALATAVLFFSLRAIEKPGLASAVLLAFAFSLAYFARYSAVFLVPAVVVALLAPSSRGAMRGRVVRLAVFAAAAALFLAPHFVLTDKAFGSPWYSENWKNLAFKLYGNGDWSYFRRIPYDGLISVVASAPLKLVVSALRELAKFFYTTLGDVGGRGVAGGIFAASTLCGVFVACFAIDRKRLAMLSFLSFYVLLSCIAFLSGSRFMIPILPLCCLLGGRFLLAGPFAGSFRIGGRQMHRAAPVVAVFCVALLLTTITHVRLYVRAQPSSELDAARMIEREYGPDVTVLGTFPFMQRYVKYSYFKLEDAGGGDVRDGDRYLRRVRSIVEEKDADFVIIGEASLKGRPVELLDAGEAAPFLEPLFRGDRVVVYRVMKGVR
ncbi:MAG: glycosyltransferase family 39 protein [Candidatus Krumholzibacteriia bacterium]